MMVPRTLWEEARDEHTRREAAEKRAHLKASELGPLAEKLHLQDNMDLVDFLWEVANPYPHSHGYVPPPTY